MNTSPVPADEICSCLVASTPAGKPGPAGTGPLVKLTLTVTPRMPAFVKAVSIAFFIEVAVGPCTPTTTPERSTLTGPRPSTLMKKTLGPVALVLPKSVRHTSLNPLAAPELKGTGRPDNEKPAAAAGAPAFTAASTSFEFWVIKSAANSGDAGFIERFFHDSASLFILCPAELTSQRKRSRLNVASGCGPL